MTKKTNKKTFDFVCFLYNIFFSTLINFHMTDFKILKGKFPKSLRYLSRKMQEKIDFQ